MNLSQQYPTMQDFEKALALAQGAIEVIRQPLYDYNLYATAGVGNLQFFTFPQGQGLSVSPGNAGNAKQLTDTNLIVASQLPAPQAYWVASIEVDFEPGSSAAANTFAIQDPSAHVAQSTALVQAGENDKMNVLSSASLRLFIGQKVYYEEGPLYRFPPRTCDYLDVAIASNSVTTAEDLKALIWQEGDRVILDPGFAIMTSMNFGVTLAWPAVVNTPSGFNGRIGVILDGWQYRAVQ